MRILLIFLLSVVGCGGGVDEPVRTGRIPDLDTSIMEPLVAQLIEDRVAAVRSQADSANAWADLGFALDAHMLLEEAEVCLEQALELDGSHFPAAYDHAFLGVLLPRDPGDVSERFRRAAELRPGYAPVLARHGDYLLVNGEVSAAMELFESALEISSQYDYARLGLARSLLESEEDVDLMRSVKLLEPLFATFPGDPAVATALGQALSLIGEPELAANVAGDHVAAVAAGQANRVPKRDASRGEILELSRSAASNFQRGERMIRAQNYEGAVLEFQRVLSVDPRNRAARTMLASTRIALRDLSAARLDLEQLLADNPRDGGAHALLGQLDTEAGQFEPALFHFTAAAREGGMDSLTFRAWVTALGSLQRWDEAIFRIGEWKTALPGDPEPYFFEAMALHNMGDQAAASSAFDEAIDRAPSHPLRRTVEPLIRR